MNKSALLCLALLILYGCNTARKQNLPNILIIHADQHRMDCIGAYDNKDVQTPNIDRLAADGVLYTRSYCPLPVCTPSRYSLLSGMYVHEHGAWKNHSTLKPSIETFPEVLKKAGYQTTAVGKMHFAPTYLDVGFENMILAEQYGPGRWDDDYHRDLMRHNLYDKYDLWDQRSEYRKIASDEYWETYGAICTNLPDSFYSTNWIARLALENIKKWDGSGNLLMVGFIKPHHPFDPPEKWAAMYHPESLSLLPGWIEESPVHDLERNPGYFSNAGLTEQALRKTMAYYYACITQIDHEVGHMIKILKDKGIYDNTMVIYTSDHGEHLGYHHQILKGGYLYESIMKVPLIIKFPGDKQKGQINHQLVSNIDLAPTILGVAGLDTPHSMSGMDLRSEPFQRDYIFGHSWSADQAMARSEQYKLIWNKNGEMFFFNLENDPLEMTDLSGQPGYREEVNAHLEAIFQWQGGENLEAVSFLDEDAPIIDQPNARKYNDGHRDTIIEYYEWKMTGR